MRWAGIALSVLVVAFLAADGLVALLKPALILPAIAVTGFPADRVAPIGLIALVSALLYAIPRTAMLGAVLVTGFLGGAICAHFRVSGTIVPPEIASVAAGIAAWGGLWLRDPRLRALLPLSS